MDSYHAQPLSTPLALTENSHPMPQTLADVIVQVQKLAFEEFDREVIQKQLCYHTRHHITGVQRRANQIFQVVRPYFRQSSDDCDRLKLLLDLCAVTHDLIQIFVPQQEPHTSRRRQAGISETATIERLLELINLCDQQYPGSSAQFSERDLQVIREAITATVCEYDPIERSIFQPALNHLKQSISPIARILALADIGALGIEGIAAYNLEGSLLFLEDNLDVHPLIRNYQIASLASQDPVLHENIRQRLLKRARFQVDFAKSRLKRCFQELAAFPSETVSTLTYEVFRHLTLETIQEIELSTPTAEDTSLKVLMDFFQLEQAMAEVALYKN